MSGSMLRTLLRLSNSFYKTENLTASDFIDLQLNEGRLSDDSETRHHFLRLIHQEKFLEEIAEGFKRSRHLFNVKEENVRAHIYYVMFLLSCANIEEVVEDFSYYMRELLEYLSLTQTRIEIAQIASRYFDTGYVLNEIMNVLVEKSDVIFETIDSIDRRRAESIKRVELTKPKGFGGSEYYYPMVTAPPPNTPDKDSWIKCDRDVPLTTYFPNMSDQKEILNKFERNKEQALKLKEEADKVPSRLTRPKEVITEPPPTIIPIKSKKPPAKKEVQIKGTTTTTLREASKLLKEQLDEINKIEELIKGGGWTERIREIEEEDRARKRQQELESIQKKHLQGLLTYEEALLAKRKLLEENKAKAQEFKEDKVKLVEQLDRLREEDEERIKQQIEKCQQLKRNVKEINQRLLEDKQSKVREHHYETKLMFQKANEEKRKELEKKIELIQELKTLGELSKRLRVRREFDPTETANLGLSCEMSIAELQERLAIARIEARRELELKRTKVNESRSNRRGMMEDVTKFIAHNRRMSKPRTVPVPGTDLERSSDLVELRRLLEEKRSLRMKMT